MRPRSIIFRLRELTTCLRERLQSPQHSHFLLVLANSHRRRRLHSHIPPQDRGVDVDRIVRSHTLPELHRPVMPLLAFIHKRRHTSSLLRRDVRANVPCANQMRDQTLRPPFHGLPAGLARVLIAIARVAELGPAREELLKEGGRRAAHGVDGGAQDRPSPRASGCGNPIRVARRIDRMRTMFGEAAIGRFFVYFQQILQCSQDVRYWYLWP